MTQHFHRIGFIGLGRMGAPMAAHLVRHHPKSHIKVYNRTHSRASEWLEQIRAQSLEKPHEHQQVTLAENVAQLGRDCDAVFTCVSADHDLREVVFGTETTPGLLSAMAPGSYLTDHSTVSAIIARDVHAACQAKGIGFIDAPVSGGQAGAENAALSIMCGGTVDDFNAIAPVLAAYAKKVGRVGDSGSGQLAKMVNQICIAGIVQGLAEALTLGMKSGLDMQAALPLLAQGAAGSWQLSNRAHTMVAGEFDFGFAVDLINKDLQLCLQQAAQIKQGLPLTAIVQQFYNELSGQGDGHLDSSALIKRLQRQ